MMRVHKISLERTHSTVIIVLFPSRMSSQLGSSVAPPSPSKVVDEQQASSAAAQAATAEPVAAGGASAIAPEAEATTTSAFAPPRWLLLFDHRSLFDVTDADYAEIAAWEEALASFGVATIDRAVFMASMSQRSASEVLMQLCPFTTRMEWPTVLNKKAIKITHEVAEWCFANAVQIPGAHEFLDACHRELVPPSSPSSPEAPPSPTPSGAAAPSSSPSSPPDVVALWLTPWQLEHAGVALGHANLKSRVVPVEVHNSDLCFFEVLENFGLRPPVETPENLAALAKYRGTTLEALVERRRGLASVVSTATNDQQQQSALAGAEATGATGATGATPQPPTVPPRARVVVFTGSSRVARIATMCGLPAVGVTYNSFNQEEDAPELLAGCDDAAALLAAGCRIALPHFEAMRPAYLSMI